MLRPVTSPTAPIVFVVGDDASVRQSLEPLVTDAGWRAATFISARDFLARPRILAPSCLVLDVSLPFPDSLDLQKYIAAAGIDMPVIAITDHADVRMAVGAMKAGAFEFLTKPLSQEVLSSAILRAIARSQSALEVEAEVGALRDRHTSLTLRERQVMELVVAGRLNKQIGMELGISEVTVKAHRGKVMRKMEAGTLADLVQMASRLLPAPAVPPHGRQSQVVPSLGERRRPQPNVKENASTPGSRNSISNSRSAIGLVWRMS